MRTNEERKDMRMLIEALYGKEILKEMLDVLKAFNSCHITHEFGKDKVSTCWCIKSSYASDHYTTREFTADDFYSPEERDENFKETFGYYAYPRYVDLAKKVQG